MKTCKICKVEMKLICFDFQSKLSEKRDSRCNECVKKLKKEMRYKKSFIKEKINVGLGVFKDSPDLLRKAIKYLDDND